MKARKGRRGKILSLIHNALLGLLFFLLSQPCNGVINRVASLADHQEEKKEPRLKNSNQPGITRHLCLSLFTMSFEEGPKLPPIQYILRQELGWAIWRPIVRAFLARDCPYFTWVITSSSGENGPIRISNRTSRGYFRRRCRLCNIKPSEAAFARWSLSECRLREMTLVIGPHFPLSANR